jgi:hypothetical protein
MPAIIFLTPSESIPNDVEDLAQTCKVNFSFYLQINIAEEDLLPNAANKIFTSKHHDWQQYPVPRITTINDLGIETLRYITTDYTINYTGGQVTFVTATTDTVRANYTFFPFTDDQLLQLTHLSILELSALIYRPINEHEIEADYRPLVCKKLYTKLLRSLLLEAKDFFSVSVGGRSISKANVTSQILQIIQSNEEEVLAYIDVLRNYNKTNRILPIMPITKTLSSNSKVI